MLCHLHPGARAWRRHLSENAFRPDADASIFDDAMARIPDEILDHRGADLPELPRTAVAAASATA